MTLAEQIIAAIPDRIKVGLNLSEKLIFLIMKLIKCILYLQNESEEMQLDASPPGESSLASDALSDSLMEPLLDEPSSSFQPAEFNFEFSDHNYRFVTRKNFFS